MKIGGGGVVGLILQPQAIDYATGLINQWPMNDANIAGGAPQVTDVTGTDNGTLNGSITSGVGPGAGAAATSRAFDGLNGTGIILASSPFDWDSGSFTIAGWVYITDVTLAQGGSRTTFFQDTRVHGTNTHFVRVCNNQSIPGGFDLETSGSRWRTTTQVFPSTPAWVHFCISNSGGGSGGSPTLFINGSSVALPTFQTGASDNADSTNYATIGCESNSGGGVSTGSIGGRMYALRIYNRVLSAASVLALYNAQV